MSTRLSLMALYYLASPTRIGWTSGTTLQEWDERLEFPAKVQLV